MSEVKKSKPVKTGTAAKTAAKAKPAPVKKAAPAKTAKPAAKATTKPVKSAAKAATTDKKTIRARGIFKSGDLTKELAKRREAKGISPRQLSIALKMSPSTVGFIEAKGSDMRVGSLIAICDALGVKASRLLAQMGH